MGWGIVYPPYSVINMGVVQPPTPTTRWVYNFNGVDSYIALPSIPVENDGFVMEGVVSPSSFPSLQNIFWAGSKDVELRLIGNSQAQLGWYDGTTHRATVTGLNLVAGQHYKFKLELLGAAGIRLTFDGQIATNADPANPLVMDTEQQLGRRNNGFFFNGLIYDVKFGDGSVYNYPINDRTFGLNAPIANSAATLGSELWNYVTSNASGSVSKIGNNSYHYNITSGESAVVRMINAVTPSDTDTYLIEFEVYDYVAGGVAWNSDGFINLGVNKNGKYKFLLKSKVADLNFSRVGSVCNLKLQNISIKQANGYATGVNLLESGWEEISI